MKNSLLALSTALLLTSCAGTQISHTDVATGATNPAAIYIRPFEITYTDFVGANPGGPGARDIRRSLAPAEFGEDLKEELSKIAPSMVLKKDEVAHVGWLVTGDIELVDSGNPTKRFFAGTFGAGQTKIKTHIRVTDLEAKNVRGDSSKGSTKGSGNIIYEFDVVGGSGDSGSIGSIYAPGLGYSVPFDYKNVAERIMMTLTPDPHHYGIRTSPTIR